MEHLEFEFLLEYDVFAPLVTVGESHTMPVEAAYQGSKVFENGGPYWDLYDMEPRAIKRDDRLGESGSLVAFDLDGDTWELEPKTAFYNLIYVNALDQRDGIYDEVREYDGFTDIEFNPDTAVNCQARALAMFVALRDRGVLSDVLADRDRFKQHCSG